MAAGGIGDTRRTSQMSRTSAVFGSAYRRFSGLSVSSNCAREMSGGGGGGRKLRACRHCSCSAPLRRRLAQPPRSTHVHRRSRRGPRSARGCPHRHKNDARAPTRNRRARLEAHIQVLVVPGRLVRGGDALHADRSALRVLQLHVRGVLRRRCHAARAPNGCAPLGYCAARRRRQRRRRGAGRALCAPRVGPPENELL